MKMERETTETKVQVEISPGSGRSSANTGVPFLDHMLSALARYSGLDITISASGDLRHHVFEDVAITLGQAFARIIPAECLRYGEQTIAMDDALVQCVIDAGGRSYYRGPLPGKLYDHWMRSFADNAGMTIHIRVLRGKDRHHVIEAAFKALGLAIRDAMREGDAVFSTKGRVVTREL